MLSKEKQMDVLEAYDLTQSLRGAAQLTGVDHHTVNFLRDQKTGIHHIAFEVRDWTDVKRASDFLAQSNVHLTWGPLRHIIGHNIAIYRKSPDGVTIEFFCELDQMHDEELGYFEPRPWHRDKPQRPKVWTPGPSAANYWGAPPPPGFLD